MGANLKYNYQRPAIARLEVEVLETSKAMAQTEVSQARELLIMARVGLH